MKKPVTFSVIMLLLSLPAITQIIEPVHWSFEKEQISKDTYWLHFKAEIDSPFYMYGMDIDGEGPIPTSINIEKNENIEKIGKIEKVKKAKTKFDPNFDMEIPLYGGQAHFKQKIQLKKETPLKVDGFVEYMSCDNEQCLPPAEETFTFNFNQDESTDSANAGDFSEKPRQEEDKTLWGILLLAMLGGLGGIFTPCVYPIIPLTVSYFMRGGSNRRKAIFDALFFGFSIIFIYTFIGLIIGLTGIDFTGTLASHWLANAIFFIIFLLLALSFFGMFEIMLPTKWSNKIDQQADKGGLLGPFFMALATVVISFSCTGPIVGILLGKATQGEIITPVIGMFGFSFVFALPFTIFAIFPSMLKNLPKSGGWLNAVKVVIAFILLALSMTFLSKIDQVYHLDILPREIFLALWISIFTLMGLYLLGKFKFSHDPDLPYLSVGRVMLAVLTFAFVFYLLPGLIGAPLNNLSSVLPPKTEQQFSLNQASTQHDEQEKKGICGESKYSDFLHLPHGLNGYFDYDQGMACAKEQDKPAFIVFKGHSCSKCKEMEAKIWADSKVLSLLKEEYVVIALYTDEKKKLPEEEWVTSERDGKRKKSIGKIFGDMQMTSFNTNTIPFHAILHPDGTKIATLDYTSSKEEFLNFLQEGIKQHSNSIKKDNNTSSPSPKIETRELEVQ